MFCSSVNALNERTVADPRFTHQELYTSNRNTVNFENELQNRATQLMWQGELIDELKKVITSKGQSPFGLWVFI